MTELAGMLDEAAEGFGGLVRAVEPDQWRLPTPCPDFTALGVVEHVVESLIQYADLADAKRFDPELTVGLAGADVFAAYRAAAVRAVGVWSREEVLAAEHSLPWGPMPGRAVLGYLVLEHVVHGWDLATATGQESPFGDALVQAADGIARGLSEQDLRQPYMFAAPVRVPGDAPLLDRLVGFLGRRPSTVD
ncbi:TIGR03086 family metal-binding protein [Amycolatopsis sp. NPDC059090]|uniref:TIGR03086 family metal-binding protein n=1 Tax=unclassified Amycolatopsis TaxID=2618356 RepID=UPI0036732976